MPYYPFIDRNKILPGDTPNPLLNAASMSKDYDLNQIYILWNCIEIIDDKNMSMKDVHDLFSNHTTDNEIFGDVYRMVISKLNKEEYDSTIGVLIKNYGRFSIGQLRLRLCSIQWDHIYLMDKHIDLMRKNTKTETSI